MCLLDYYFASFKVCSFLDSSNFANLISKLNFYKLIPYPMDNCFTGQRDRSRQTPEKDVLYIIPAGLVTECTSFLLSKHIKTPSKLIAGPDG